MKMSLALGERRPLSRQQAWGCFTSNLAVPGSGSLVAGHPVGYAQLAVTFCAFGLTLVATARFFVWALHNRPRNDALDPDPIQTLFNLWNAARWPLVGIALFAVVLLWALATSLSILSEARRHENSATGSGAPPVIKP
jgi:hypothetical protein